MIPGNDDALRAIRLFASRVADAVLAGRALREAKRPTPEQSGAPSPARRDKRSLASPPARRLRPARQRSGCSGLTTAVSASRRVAPETRPSPELVSEGTERGRPEPTRSCARIGEARANEHFSGNGAKAPGEDRGRNDGLQDGARGGQGRQRDGATDPAAQEGPGRGGQEGRAGRRARGSSATTSTPAARWACSSRSTARPTSWPRHRVPGSSSRTSPCTSPRPLRSTSPRKACRRGPREGEGDLPGSGDGPGQAARHRREDRRGQARRTTTRPSACSSSRTSRSPSRPSASSCRRRSR